VKNILHVCVISEAIWSFKYFWGRYYDFKNIFAKNFNKKIGIFWLKLRLFLQIIDFNIGFEKFFSTKIVENR
jgi:hypothetical protein